MKVSSITAFFPCYNEEQNVQSMVEAFYQVLPKIAKKFEIIIINDGSSDGTLRVTKKLCKLYPELRFITHKRNKGYGASLRSGFVAARYDWTFFTDGDLQFDVDQLKSFLPHTKKSEVIIGYRENRAEGQLRAFNAKLFKRYIDLLFRLHVKDIDCAFKLIKTKVLQEIPLTSTGAFTSAELLYRLKKSGYRFKQLPVRHYLRQFGKPTGNHPLVIVKAGWEALQLYLMMKFTPLKVVNKY